jgi:hypothetical protein
MIILPQYCSIPVEVFVPKAKEYLKNHPSDNKCIANFKNVVNQIFDMFLKEHLEPGSIDEFYIGGSVA